MALGEKLAGLRKEHHHTQEQLAAILNVSRQSVSKWESDLAFPETDKLIRISELYSCSLDYLLKDGPRQTATAVPQNPFLLRYEYKSKRSFHGLPLVHISIGFGAAAKGVVAVGYRAKGLVSVGLCSVGLVSFGVVSAGLISLGVLSAGLLLGLGCICAGLIAVGAISVGVFSLGALAVGQFAIGALAIGQYAALGDHASAMVAQGQTEAIGSLFSHLGHLSAQEKVQAMAKLDACVPWYLGWAKAVFSWFL